MIKSRILATVAILTTMSITLPSQAENLSHLSQLLSTRKCSECDLSGSGLVLANLAGADLRGANLVGANLSRANLTGADLSGANLAGASLHGANLTGANLTGANLNGTDMRNAYLSSATMFDTDMSNAYVRGATGIPLNVATPEQFYNWGVTEANRGNHKAALSHYNKAIINDPEFAPAYLGRGVMFYRLGDDAAALENAKMAASLFETQENTEGFETSQGFVDGLQAKREGRSNGGGGNFGRVMQTVGSLLLRFLLR